MKTLRLHKLIVVFVVFSVCIASYFLHTNQLMPLLIKTFMGNYGLHATGTIAYSIFFGGMFSFFKVSDEDWLSPLVINNVGFTFPILIGVLVAWVISLLGECAQYFDPKRVVDIWDVIAQTIGCFIGFLTLLWATR